MNLSITLEEPLASQLRQEATARQLSPEETASELLVGLLRRMAEDAAWKRTNQRRLQLIRKGRDDGLTPEELSELDLLQEAADHLLAPVDRQLLAEAEQFRLLTERLPDATAP